MNTDEEIDLILPVLGYSPAEAYSEIRSIHGTLLQQRSRFEQMTNRQIDSISAIDSRFGAVSRRLDRIEQQVEEIDAKLARLLELLCGRY